MEFTREQDVTIEEMSESKKRIIMFSPEDNPYIVLIKGECKNNDVNSSNGREILHRMLDEAIDEYDNEMQIQREDKSNVNC